MRSYIEKIGSIKDWKQDFLYCYSDLHKDVYGTRSGDSWLMQDETTMEQVMSHYFNLIARCNAQADADWKKAQKRIGHKHFHRLMVEEASRHPDGVVYINPEWDDQCEYDSYYAEYLGIEKWEYYIPVMNTNDQLGNIMRFYS